ncbi:MAG: 2-oxoglutarate oxidoreductase, partial [Clostridia bacterium]|nr:2-oxoglutarate oxidoreductase [Clostridia bacterium]
RDVKTQGNPIRVCEMLASLDGPAYIERVTVNNIKNIKAAKAAIEKAFRYQVEGKGYSFVEVVSTCPTNWGMSPIDAMKWMEENMLKHYPLGVFRDVEEGK